MRRHDGLSATAAGVGATLVMSAYMLGAESHDAIGTPPPVRIVRRVRPDWPADRVSVAATLLHLGIGAGGGLLAALLRSRQWTAAQQMLEQRRGFDPDGVPLNRDLARVYEALDLPTLAAQAAARADRTEKAHA